ncbi:MAG: DUF7453 family protein [Aeoliella sp.]
MIFLKFGRTISTVILAALSVLVFAAARTVSATPALPVRTVALSGQPPTGTVSVESFQRFDRAPMINESGKVAFFAAPEFFPGEPFAGNTSVWSEGGGGLGLVVRQGIDAPGLSIGVQFDEFFDLAFNNAGQTVFRSRLAGASVDSSNRESIWITGHQDLQLLLCQGDVAPAVQDNAIIDAIVDPFTLSDAGQIAVALEVNGNGGIDPVTAGL